MSKKDRYYAACLSKRRLRSHSNHSFDAMVHHACKDDGTYVSMQVYNDLIAFFGGSENKRHSKNKKYLRYEKAPSIFPEDNYTAVFDCGTTYQLRDAPGIPYYNYGISRICNGLRYYKSGPAARMALIVEMLIRIALGEIKGVGQTYLSRWHMALLPDSKKDTNDDFCVIHSSHYAIAPGVPIGVIFFHGCKRVFAVPTGLYLECWQFYDLDRKNAYTYFERRTPIRMRASSIAAYKESTFDEELRMRETLQKMHEKKHSRKQNRLEHRKKKRRAKNKIVKRLSK